MYKIIFEKKAKKQFYKLNRNVQKRLTKAIDEKLAVNPKEHLIPLSDDKAGFYKFRVGDYRLLCSREDDKLLILIVRVKHRKEAHRTL